MSAFKKQRDKVANGKGFIAALDQSGGSTPKALSVYGIDESHWSSEADMFKLVHEMRERIVSAQSFTGKKIIGAILFENTMNNSFNGKNSADYLWEDKGIVPFLKIDKGLMEEEGGVQIMKPNSTLLTLLERAKEKNIFGTKMRSVIKKANKDSIKRLVEQQFETAEKILGAGLIPIVEPEVDIHCDNKQEAEELLKNEISRNLDSISDNSEIMLKLTLPEINNFYKQFVSHNKILKVVALSGGYSRAVANERLSKNNGVVASFSRALTEGLSYNDSDENFEKKLSESIEEICTASIS